MEKENDFKKIVERIKEDTIDPVKTKKYILAIKSVLDKAIENCKDEQSKEEILNDFLEEYEKEIKEKKELGQVFSSMLHYRACKRIIAEYKGNRSFFNKIIREARAKEKENNKEKIFASKDSEECMVSKIRTVLRRFPNASEKEILDVVQQGRAAEGKALKERMISIIQESVAYLEEYGFLDEYINNANKRLEKIGLSKLKFTKRNPIADEEYDENGKIVKNKEDIGVVDSFSTEYLEQLSPEDLIIMATFWKSKYMEERLEMSKAMATIQFLDLKKELLLGDISNIENLDNQKILSALKKDLALTYLYRAKAKITSTMKKQYSKFLKDNNLSKGEKLEDEIKSLEVETKNLQDTVEDITVLQCIIMHQLQAKDIKLKKWGIIDQDELEDSTDGVVVVLENQNFRGPLIMEVPKNVIQGFFETETLDFPKYEGEVDEDYSLIMSKLYLPTNEFFKKTVMEAYNKNPNSNLIASMLGKKARTR